MLDTASNTYDTVLYPGFALAQAHPDRLATLATLFGMTPPDVSRCRVLELGCGDGTNLISIALGLPEAECVGIDLAAAGIRKGQGMIQELGLKNVTLRQLSIMDIGRDFGQFDFIIAHGIYSWVPPEVRDKILTICKGNLAENGVAYVSYNTHPGGHLRDMVREMMLFHVREFTDPQQRVDQARALIKFVTESSRAEPAVYQMVLQKELERITEFRDSSLFHDDLGEYNEPIYFYRFVEHAARHGLKYLSEAHIFEMQTGIFPPEVVEVLNQISDSLIAKEQYLDFLKGRRFRQTLLCHEDRELDSTSRPEKMAHFHIASPVRPESANLDLRSRDVVAFLGPKNSSIKTDNPLIKVAMIALGEAWPQALHFNDLLATARKACGRGATQGGVDIDEDVRVLGDMLLRAYAGAIIELHVHPPRFVLQLSERPVASPLARLQSRGGGEITNLRHHTVAVENALGRRLIQLLDGSRDRATLLNDLIASVESGVISAQRGGESIKDPREIRKFLAAELEQNLVELAQLAVLVG
jgi:methyltransferase-like protein/cyclopropane fatty-acyl-phospholipid synthase-like methyltransferase